ncbi:MAG: hypothetical protein ABIN94_06065 [Ferruginibacter sp.]
MKTYIAATASLLFLIMQIGMSQALRQPITAIYLNLGAYSTKHNDVFSFLNNQAALAQTKFFAAGVYSEKRFMLAATGLYAAAVAIPSKSGNFGLQLKYAGFKNFSQSELGFAYARSLGEMVDIGVQFNYYSYQVPGYIAANAVNFEMGVMIHLTEQLNAGIHVYNPVGGKLLKTGEQLTAAFTAGMGYDVSEIIFVSAEVVKEEGYPVNVHAGMQYQFMKQFFARAGISSATSAAYGGVGIGWNDLRLDISGSYHPQLGWSPALLLMIQLGKEKQVITAGK